MADRRALIEGLKSKPGVNRTVEDQFVYGSNSKAASAAPPIPAEAPQPRSTATTSRVGLTTRVRADFFQALKRASLERQLKGVEPNRVQDILEEALEPWLKSHGYLT